MWVDLGSVQVEVVFLVEFVGVYDFLVEFLGYFGEQNVGLVVVYVLVDVVVGVCIEGLEVFVYVFGEGWVVV